jgi:hypothetical protein
VFEAALAAEKAAAGLGVMAAWWHSCQTPRSQLNRVPRRRDDQAVIAWMVILKPVPTALLSTRCSVLAGGFSWPTLVTLCRLEVRGTLFLALLGLHHKTTQAFTHYILDQGLPLKLRL